MIDTPTLPTKANTLAAAIDSHVAREESRLAYRRLTWLLAFYYLNGARTFTVFEPTTGRLKASMVDSKGDLEFQSYDLVVILNRVIARLCSLNLMPRVLTQGTSLQGQRERGVAQLFLDAAITPDEERRVQMEFATVFATCGSCGIMGHVVDHAVIGITGDMEIVHPSQVFPFPATGTSFTNAGGVIRQRFMPQDKLVEMYGRKITANIERMDAFKVAHGDPLNNVENQGGTFGTGTEGMLPTRGGQSARHGLVDDMQEVVKVREVWLKGVRGTVERYACMSGDYVIEDVDCTRKEVYCPLGWARFYESGTFHGLGLFDVLFSVCRQAEKLAKTLFKNINDADKYGVLVIPSGQWSERAQLRPVAPGLNVLPWEPDPMAEGFRPFAVAPANSGDMPGKVAQFARQMMGDLSPLKDLSQEKGRVDSFSGLQLLDEQLNQPMAKPTQSMEQAFSDCYRGVAQGFASHLAASPRPIPVTRLSLDLAGVVIDPTTGDVSFPENPLPDISRLSFRAVEVTPRSEAAKKQEALTLMEKGVQDAVAFKLYCIQEGLPLAAYIEGEKAAVETVTRNILLLYGDGQQPGEVVLTPDTSNADVQIRVLSAFMQRPIVGLASVEVQNALIHYRQTLMQMTGAMLPPGVPAPEDASLMGMMNPHGAPVSGPPAQSSPPPFRIAR